MSRFILTHPRLVGALVAAALLSNTSLAALAQPAPTGVDCSAFRFEIANPSPGSRLDPGDYVLHGIAQDTRAEQGAGIDHIDFFIGNRDSGGVIIGRAIPGALGAVEPFGPNSFRTTIRVPNNVPGGRELFGYARSAVAEQEVIVSMPLAVNVEPDGAGDLLASPQTVLTCTAPVPASPPAPVEVEGVVVGEMPEAAPQEAPAEMAPAQEEMTSEEAPATDEAAMPEVAGVTAEAAAQEESGAPEESAMPEAPAPEEPRPLAANARMYFAVGNPSPGDYVHVGDLLVEGMAFDRSTEDGHGIMRVEVFLGDRDTGGVVIGQAQLGMPNPVPNEPQISNAGWRARVNVPSSAIGPRTLFFYAHSGVTDGQMVVQVPVLVVQ